jgi:dTDP-4-amino-4,6-dideoxygalactose transaminase/acetyltransferase-like isoleucine patch superfamily enzyme
LNKDKNYFAHESAYIDDGCEIGDGTKIWHFSHIMSNCKLGKHCNIGQNVVISPEVVLGNNVKVQNNVSIYTGVTCDDDVFLGPSMVFTNVINPRSAINRKSEYLKTHVGKGASIGANATIVCGHKIGTYAFIGAGAVVTKEVLPYALVVGNPARQIGWVSEYGHRLTFNTEGVAICHESQAKYQLSDNSVSKIESMFDKKNIQMVDLQSQYKHIKEEIGIEIQRTLDTSAFINGSQVNEFQHDLEVYLGVKHVIPCANGTDALQIAMMALNLKRGDEVILPSFTYVATAEVMALLDLKPIMVDVDPHTFNITAEIVERAITPRTKAIVPVHLFGQSVEMEAIMSLAQKHNLYVIEDNAQAIGSDYTFTNGHVQKTGTIGHIGCTSFFPSKNLGCYGDGGALMTNDDELATSIRMIANHGQKKKYYHSVIGVNSRLDSIQAGILKVKLKQLDKYAQARNNAAAFYDNSLKNTEGVIIPVRQYNSTHVFHQYTLLIKNGMRNNLQTFLQQKGIPTMIYYPVPLYKQEAFAPYYGGEPHINTELLCDSVLSLPMHTEMNENLLSFITESIQAFFNP